MARVMNQLTAAALIRHGLILTVLLLSGTAASLGAAIMVTNTNDSGPGSFRQALADAANGDTINFNLTRCPCTIPILSTGFQIQKSLTIPGPGADQRTIDGGNRFYRCRRCPQKAMYDATHRIGSLKEV